MFSCWGLSVISIQLCKFPLWKDYIPPFAPLFPPPLKGGAGGMFICVGTVIAEMFAFILLLVFNIILIWIKYEWYDSVGAEETALAFSIIQSTLFCHFWLDPKVTKKSRLRALRTPSRHFQVGKSGNSLGSDSLIFYRPARCSVGSPPEAYGRTPKRSRRDSSQCLEC